MTNTDRPRLGIGLRIQSGMLFSGMAICVQAVSEEAPLGEIAFLVRLCADPVNRFPVDGQ